VSTIFFYFLKDNFILKKTRLFSSTLSSRLFHDISTNPSFIGLFEVDEAHIKIKKHLRVRACRTHMPVSFLF